MYPLIPTVTVTENLGESKIVQSNCIAIEFLVPLTGNSIQVNGVPVAAGSSRRISMSEGFLDTTQYNIVIQSGAGVDECYVSRTVVKDMPRE